MSRSRMSSTGSANLLLFYAILLHEFSLVQCSLPLCAVFFPLLPV